MAMTTLRYALFLNWRMLMLAAFSVLISLGCKKMVDTATPKSMPQHLSSEGEKSESDKVIGSFAQVNLVANNPGYGAANIDPTLVNSWGLTFSPNGFAWIGSQAGHVSNVYNREGATILGPVHIPSPGGPQGGNPTGVVFNPGNADFIIPGGPARFIFVGVDGVVSAWNGTFGNHAFKKFTVPGSAFTGLALANMGVSSFLYATNFRARKINVWDKNWNPVNINFMDPEIPSSFAPFNIQNLGGLLYVSYAKVGPAGRSQQGDGLGFVDIFQSNGTLVKRLASEGSLNAPWGIAMAPAGFFAKEMEDDMDKDDRDHEAKKSIILVGNFGNGRINAFRSDGKFLGQLGSHERPLVIEGLWALVFPPTTSTIDPNRLYFAAGPDMETNGLFGYILSQKEEMEQD
ncbi:MAG: TIGR03118 family protein [Flavisolibacter sp.]